MGLFNLWKKTDFHQGIKEYAQSEGAFLLDVRSPQEYKSGHIPGSYNLPLKRIAEVGSVAESKEAKLFVYCQSGARSRQAAAALRRMGYMNVKNIGGMASYKGRVVK
jgi:rhodanese-related sulfurtransferase